MRIILALLLLLTPAFALSIQTSGDCVNKEVYIYTDQPSFLILRMNYGVPIYANSTPQQPAVFIPRITGDLLITAISDAGETSKVIRIRECKATYFAPTPAIMLPDGSFEEQGKKISWRTAFGALKKACESLGYSYSTKLSDWGIFVECIRGICTGSLGKTSGWMYWVNYPNKPIPGISASDYRIYPGDEIIWYFSRSMDEKPDTSPYAIIIKIGTNYELQINVKWESKIRPVAEFEFTPLNPIVGEEVIFNASKSYDDREIVRYQWVIEGKVLEGKIVAYRFDKEGEYEVKLTVFDNEGLSDSITKIVNVKSAEKLDKFIVQGERALNLGYGVLIIRAENAEVSIINETCRVSQHDVKGCFSLEANASISAIFETTEAFKIIDLNRDRWILVKKDNGNYSANISTGKFAILSQWEKFPLKENDERIKRAIGYLKSLQRDDGGFGEQESLFSATCWAIMAIVSAGENPEDWKKNDKSPMDYVREKIKDEIPKMGTADLARTILALVYANKDPRNFEGYNLVDMLKEKVKDNGQIGDYVYTTIWGALALKAVGEDISRSVEWLKSVQNPDGGFPWIAGELSDCDDTSAAIQVLMLAKEYRVVSKAIEYLKTCQNPDGGMRYFGESASNSASDSWAIQALVSAGENPMEFKRNSISVVDHLLSLQTAEGYFKYTSYETSNPGYMTTSAIMALLGKYHPIKILPVYSTNVIAVGNETKIRLPMDLFLQIYVDEITIYTAEGKNLTVKIEKLREIPETLKLENAIAYFSINVEPKNLSGYITFVVPKDAKDNFVLAKFEAGEWRKLKTELLGSDENYRYYRAFTHGFSYFAIAKEFEEKLPEIEKTTPKAETTITTPTVAEKSKSTPGFELTFAILAIALVFLRLRK
ncbi:MAG: prenyltransferase/squalene oxidase repeat-containing protein [Archaeoglobaceae archaeon]